ncbi:class 1 fructose-bisphosphatase [Gemmatimonas sp.]|jgi:fructose-1,6-bisphosphatase I/sedoheptulose-1,7-bisphosphatase|uniref:class 1 fructose-bisphosphatase n=1 Tax=Gemmatimonas sp. TaxID=1962908 RepID=UPI0037C1150D
MLTGGRPTLAQFIIEERRQAPGATGEFDALITDIALACKAISQRVALGVLVDDERTVGNRNVHGEEQQPLDIAANDLFLRAAEWGGHLAGMASEELEQPYAIPSRYPLGKYLLLFDPLDGSSNIDVNMSVGSIFSVLRAPTPGAHAQLADFLQPGTAQVCAGYAVYGPSTMLVLTFGRGTHGFTLEPQLGEWVLTHPNLRVAPSAREFAINASNHRFWELAVRRYVDECLAGTAGPRGVDFNMRWIASLVAETHRILMRGGVFLYPRDSKAATKHGRLRMLYETNPIAFLIEQAGGMASTGERRMMDEQPTGLHQRSGFVFGSSEEVLRIEQYHQHQPQQQPRQQPEHGDHG